MIDTRPEFRRLAAKLIELLGTIEGDDWNRATISSRWSVRDIVAHMLDGSMRRVSLHRDAYTEFYLRPDLPAGFDSLFAYLDHLNAQWVAAARRLSPAILVELVTRYDALFADLMDAADLEGPAFFPVAWAGETSSRNWMDFAREYTEKWYHQQQIRMAFQSREIEAPEYLHPVYRIFMRAVPFFLSQLRENDVGSVSIRIIGPAGGQWDFRKVADGWIRSERLPGADAVLQLDAAWAWRFFTNRAFKASHRDAVDYAGPPGAESALRDMLMMMA